jgi:hypothetical protein
MSVCYQLLSRVKRGWQAFCVGHAVLPVVDVSDSATFRSAVTSPINHHQDGFSRKKSLQETYPKFSDPLDIVV